MPRMSKHAPAKVLCSLRQREAAEYRAQKLTMQETADKMGISKPRVSQLLDAWDENFKTENTARAAQLQEEQLEDLRLLKSDWRPQAQKDVKALQTYLKLIALESDIAGTKAPTLTKTELTGKDGGPLTTVQTTLDANDYTTEELEALQKILDKKPPGAPQ